MTAKTHFVPGRKEIRLTFQSITHSKHTAPSLQGQPNNLLVQILTVQCDIKMKDMSKELMNYEGFAKLVLRELILYIHLHIYNVLKSSW